MDTIESELNLLSWRRARWRVGCAPKYYDLVVLDDEGNWKVLRSDVTYEDADHHLDVYTDQFPHAILDILPHKDNA
jgi:hypothetical protein